MKTALVWVLRIARLFLLVMGLAELITGETLWLPASPEVDSGPPARIGGAVVASLGLLLGVLSARRPPSMWLRRRR